MLGRELGLGLVFEVGFAPTVYSHLGLRLGLEMAYRWD